MKGGWIGVSEKEVSLYVKEIKHTMACEGLPLTRQNEDDVTDILRGRRTEKEVKDAILKRNGLPPQ